MPILLKFFQKIAEEKLSKLILRGHYCQGAFSFKGSNMLFFSFVCHFSRILYFLSVCGKQEWAELRAVFRTEIMRKDTCLDSFQWLPSVTPFSESLQWPYLKVIYSVMPLLLRIWHAFWPFEDCYLFGFVSAQLFFFNCLKLPCMKIYKYAFLPIKHPCFTWDLGPLHPSSPQLQSAGLSLQRPWHTIDTKAGEDNTQKRKLQANITDEHICKNPL